jgi:chemotaxis protein methyltransferase CheR
MEAEEIEIRLLLEGIHARYGYDLRDYATASLRRRVLSALGASGLPHLGELLHQVLNDREVFAVLLDGLTVRVSELFRDPAFFRAFRSRVIPLLRTYPTVKIWNAGCATGEEAYAGAILIAEEQLAERTQIYATDLSQRALEQAKDGVYPASSRAAFEQNHLDSGGTSELSDYITTAYEQIAMSQPLRKRILFFQHDLVSDHAFAEMNVIMCRNVLIYFNPDLRERVLAKLAKSLCPGGFLCLGSSERIGTSQAASSFTSFAFEQRIYRYEP